LSILEHTSAYVSNPEVRASGNLLPVEDKQLEIYYGLN
jgi:hypothetical protein